MTRMRTAVLTVGALALSLAALWLTTRGQAPAGAQDQYPAAIATTLRATRAEVPQGYEVGLVGGLHNEGSKVLEIAITCDPPVDFEITGPDGGVVWHWSSPCTGNDTVLRIEPGVRREWDTTWNGTNSEGHPVAPGTYLVWAIVHTAIHEAVAGPLALHVGGDAPTEQPHDPTATAAHEPTHVPEPTRGPEPTHEPGPTATPHEGGAAFEIGDGAGAQRQPDVAGDPELNDCQNLVVWYDEPGHAIRGRFVEPNWRGDVLNISNDAGASGPAAVAYNSRTRLWLVVWPVENDNGNTDLKGRYAACGNLQESVFPVTDGVWNDDQVAVASHGEGFAVVWHRVTDGGASQIHGQALFGTRVAGHVVLEDGGASEPGVACEPAEPCLAVWSAGAENHRDVIGRWWWPREEMTGEHYLTIAGGDSDQHEPAVAWNGTDLTRAYLVTWTQGGADASAIFGRGVGVVGDGNGTTKDAYDTLGEAARISGEGGPAKQSDVGSLGTGFAVVWLDSTHEPGWIRGRHVRVRRDGGPGGIIDISGPTPQVGPVDSYPAVAAAGSVLGLVVWQSDSAGGPGAIRGRHIEFPAGSVVLAQVELVGRVTAVEGGAASADAAPQAAARISVAVEQVLSGRFSCSSAEVYYDAASWPGPYAVGDRLRITGAQEEGSDACALAVGDAGTQIQYVDQRRFTPYLYKP